MIRWLNNPQSGDFPGQCGGGLVPALSPKGALPPALIRRQEQGFGASRRLLGGMAGFWGAGGCVSPAVGELSPQGGGGEQWPSWLGRTSTPRGAPRSDTDSPLSLGGVPGAPLPPSGPGDGRAVGDAPRGANKGLPCELSPTPFSPLCPCLHPARLGGCGQRCLMRAGSCCRRLPAGKRPPRLTRCGLTARPRYTMGRGGGPGAAGTRAPLHGHPRTGRAGSRCCTHAAWRESCPHPGCKPVCVIPAGCFAFSSVRMLRWSLRML